MFSAVFKADIQASRHTFGDDARHCDAAGFCESLQAGRYVDAFPVTVVAFYDHVAEVHADPHVNAALMFHTVVALCHRPLQDDGAFDRVDYAAKFGQKAVAHQLEDAATVSRDCWLEELFAVGAESLECVRLVLLHETAVADYVRGQYGGEVT
jgi:hypothetical protein